MTNNAQKDSERLNFLMQLAKIGWWEADLKNEVYTYSDFIAETLGINYNSCPFSLFHDMIREDFRSRVINELIFEPEAAGIDFPVKTAKGTIWVHTKHTVKEKTGNETSIITGSLQVIDDPEKDNKQEATIHKFNNLLYQQSNISKSLFSFLQNEDIKEIVNKTLGDLLTQFKAERGFIMEYDWKKNVQNCLFEVTTQDRFKVFDKFQNIPLEDTQWWDEQICALDTIAISHIDQIPEGDTLHQDFIKVLGVKSTLIVPLVSNNNEIWGYAGVDTIEKPRNWSKEDKLWFSSQMNVINICMLLRKLKDASQKDKDYFQNLYKHMPIGFMQLKMVYKNDEVVDYDYTVVNKEIELIFETPVEEFLNKKGSQVDKDLNDKLEKMRQVINTDKHIKYDYHIISSNKHCRIVMFSPQKDTIVVLFLDVTETFRIHQALEESEQLLRNIYRSLPIGLEIFDKNGILIEANEKDVEILGMTEKKQYLGVNIFDHPVLPLEVKERMKKGESMDFNSSYDFSRVPEGYYKSRPIKKGAMNLTTKIVPVTGKDNQIQNYIFINIDNTATTNAYLRIQEFEEYFSLIADFAKVGYFKWDLIKNEGFAISQWFKNLNKAPNTLITKDIDSIYEKLVPEDAEAIKEFYRKAVTGEVQTLQREVQVITGDSNKPKWLRCTFTIKEYDPENDTIELIGLSIDITELKEMILAKDKAEALDKFKSAFLASMSHEIRTPLNAIVGFSTLLTEVKEGEERNEYVRIIRHNNDLLLKLVSDILDLSKIEANMFELSNSNINIKELSMGIMLAMRTKETPQVKLLFDESLPDLTLYGDADRITQVITNLMNNALKFTPKGHIRYGYKELDNSMIQFYVEDTGIGIAPENLEVIFERFVKLDSFAQGTGLGLAICKNLIEQMGGEIGVESQVGVGSRLWFTLPYLQKPQYS